MKKVSKRFKLEHFNVCTDKTLPHEMCFDFDTNTVKNFKLYYNREDWPYTSIWKDVGNHGHVYREFNSLDNMKKNGMTPKSTKLSEKQQLIDNIIQLQKNSNG